MMPEKDKSVSKAGDFDLFDDNSMMMVMMMVMMMMVMGQFLSPIAQSQAQIAQTLEAQSYHGSEDPRVLAATARLQWINLVYNYPFTPWISVFLINDGPSPVEIGINYPDDRFTMNPGETITINRTGAADEKINILFYVCAVGLDASVRATGTY